MPIATIKMDIPEGMTAHDLRLMLADAIGEFRAARGPTAAEYVAKRYPLPAYDTVYPEGPHRDRKIAEIEKRRGWAAHIRDTGFKVEVGSDSAGWVDEGE